MWTSHKHPLQEARHSYSNAHRHVSVEPDQMSDSNELLLRALRPAQRLEQGLCGGLRHVKTGTFPTGTASAGALMPQIVELRCSGLLTPRVSQWRGTTRPVKLAVDTNAHFPMDTIAGVEEQSEKEPPRQLLTPLQFKRCCTDGLMSKPFSPRANWNLSDTERSDQQEPQN